MIELSAQADAVNKAIQRLPMQKPQRDAMVAAVATLQKMQAVQTKLLAAWPDKDKSDEVANELLDLLGLAPRQVVSVYGDGKHAPVPQG